MDQESVDYFRARERVELAAAEAAANESARRAHLELAQGYAALASQGPMTPAEAAEEGD